MGIMGGHFVDMFETRDEWFNLRMLPFILVWAIFAIVVLIWLFITLFVPNPRPPFPQEKQFTTVDKTGDLTDPEPLPCWYEDIIRRYSQARREDPDRKIEVEKDITIEPAEVFMTLVVPAFNEEDRLSGMLEEAVNFLETEYGSSSSKENHGTGLDTLSETVTTDGSSSPTPRKRKTNKSKANGTPPPPTTTTTTTTMSTPQQLRGWEIILVDDGSTDHTLLTAQTFSRKHILPAHPRRDSGPWTHRSPRGVTIPPGSIRMVSLVSNRGKGGAVVHGMRHARGQYVLFADADGASKFSDLGKLVSSIRSVEDDSGRAVAVGSRAHLVGSEAVVKRSKLRNFLMHSFHLLLRFMTPPATARVADTQCGFKLFSRASLPYIVPHMHMEGWIFDVEMLMLAEFSGIPVVEVPIGWREVIGSKLNVVRDSIGMAWGLALLRICWGTGIYRKGA